MTSMMHAVRARRGPHREHGAAAVEFALVLPILLLVVFGIISFGILFAQQLSLGNGARQGARLGVVAQNSCSDIAREARSGSQTIGMNADDVRVIVKVGPNEGSLTSKCDVAAGSPGSSTTIPCLSATDNNKLFVYTVYPSEVTVPLVPIKKTMILESVGVFRCEFREAT